MLSLESEIESLRPALLKAARRLVLSHDAEDLVQEAVARALERRSVLRADTNLRAWMKPVMRNLAIDEGRRMRRLRPLEDVAATGGAPEEHVPCWAAFDRSHIERALDGCSPELKTTFELHYWQALSLDAIAHKLGVARATVGTRLYRARAQIRRELERSSAVVEA
ncbi:MAG: RNA polymerase sigma factor [Polyangiales bacterium]